MRLVGSKKAIADLLDLGGTEDDIVSLLPEEPEDMASTCRHDPIRPCGSNASSGMPTTS